MKSVSRLSVLVGALAVISMMSISSAWAQKKHEHGKKHEKHARCPMMDKDKGHAESKAGKMKHMDKMLEKLEVVQNAIDEGNTEEASAKLGAIVDRMEDMRKKMKQMKQKHGRMEKQSGEKAAEGKPVNESCPIMGNKIDPEEVPEKLTREFQGKTVGFCCGACPERWDELDEDEKKEKLDEAMENN